MNIVLYVDSVQRTSGIVIDSLVKEDIINEQKDSLRFRVEKYDSVGFTPTIGEVVEMTIDGATSYLGAIVSLEKSIQAGEMVVYDVTCSDCSICLGRELVLEKFEDETVGEIIDFIVDKYASAYGFTDTSYVVCDIEIDTMVFNRMAVPECLEKLARTVNYSWYSDYERKIHFFAKDTNIAPFEITDTNGNYLQNSLSIRDDLSQIRNSVVVRGGDEEGIARTESYIADGEQVMFPLSNKFAEKPSIYIQDEVASSTIGVDFLDDEDDYDCFWSFQQKYIRFKDGTKPAIDKAIEISGIPLFPIIVKRIDPASADPTTGYGLHEFFIENKDIESRAEALEFAQAQLESYKDGIIEGKFQTDESGLRSGQLITIDSDLLNIDETFLIQRVQFRALAKDKGLWSVTLATLRTVGIIQILQDLIRASKVREFDPDNLLTLVQFSDEMSATDSLGTPSATSPPYLWVGNGVGLSNPIKYNFWTYDDS